MAAPTVSASKMSQSELRKSYFICGNPIRYMREREERRQAAQAQEASASSSSANRNASVAAPTRQQCPNRACPKPNVVDGTCQTCGRVADESNIVAEVQFGEASSGAAIVQGSFVGADQAGIRSIGSSFRRVGGTEDREKSIREARGLMQGFAQQLNVSESLITRGVQVFKLASSANFVQGRTLASVAVVCLYAACRSDPPCKIMLIDLADLVQLNVFKLGRIFKKLNELVPLGTDSMMPVFPEDLIWRFATKMEFHQDTAKVAEDAVRLVKRMSCDWLVMGRRPSGICGACLLMAARMHNFRRTIREVVYIVKVTNHTIQNRLQEFNVTETSKMSVEDFLKQDFLESSHDPPSYYRNSGEYKAMMAEKSRKRKRKGGEAEPEGIVEGGAAELESDASKRQHRLTDAGADLSDVPAISYRRDADGFIIPPLPSQISQDQSAAEAGNNGNVEDGDAIGNNLEELASEFGDAVDDEEDVQPSAQTAPSSRPRGRPSRNKPQLPINDEWEQDEQELEGQIEEIFNDPLTYEHALAYSNAEQRVRIHTNWALSQQPPREISMAADIGEDEFAEDPEVANCLLSPEEARIKELIWVNQNKDWLRQYQEKVFRRKMEADRPKQTRRRRKRARIGEGQTSPASSAAEAAINVAKDRAWSKRINYDAIRSMFDVSDIAGLGSNATSRKTSRAGSLLGTMDGDEEQGDVEMRDVLDDGAGDGHGDQNGKRGGNMQTEEFEGDSSYDEDGEDPSAEFDDDEGGNDAGDDDDDNPEMDTEYGLEAGE